MCPLGTIFARETGKTSFMNLFYRLSFSLCLVALTGGLAAQNIAPVGELAYPDRLSDIWGYTDPGGHEYALVGAWDGFSIVDVTTDPANPTELFYISGPPSVWRDIKVWGDHAYVIHDGTADGSAGVGLLIVDLSTLPASIDTVTVRDFGGGYYMHTTHNLFIDENGVGYLCGGDWDLVGGVLMLDLTIDPMAPVVLGVYDANYVHDLFVRGDTMWTGEIYTGSFGVVDVANKAAPVVLATQQTPTLFTHNLWLSDDGATLVTTDEVGDGYLGVFDVSDLSDITELARWVYDAGSGTIPHNAFFVGDYVVTSHYTAGVTIHDANNPTAFVMTGHYDTSPFSGGGFSGCWGVYPYAPSGLIFASDVETGLHILDPTYAQAAYIEGVVTEAGSGTPIFEADIQIVGGGSTVSDITGNYATGSGTSGNIDLVVSKYGYETKTVDAACR